MGLERCLELVESVGRTRVLFVGDTIVDEYCYVRPLGKSPKEHLVATAYLSSEVFRGGVEAAAEHARSFCGEVFVSTGGVGVRKVRMVDRVYLRKLFEVHYPEAVDGVGLMEADVTVVCDFGHGYVTRGMVGELCDGRWLAVNAQTNSANIGFNLITKYPRADYVVIDEPEARLAAADRDSPLWEVMEKLARGRFGKFVVTRGMYGAAGWCEESGYEESGALTDKPVDTMGAGDAFFAVTAPMAKMGKMEDLLRIGNAAGALKTQIVGHRAAVTKVALVEYLKATA